MHPKKLQLSYWKVCTSQRSATFSVIWTSFTLTFWSRILIKWREWSGCSENLSCISVPSESKFMPWTRTPSNKESTLTIPPFSSSPPHLCSIQSTNFTKGHKTLPWCPSKKPLNSANSLIYYLSTFGLCLLQLCVLQTFMTFMPIL